MMQLVRTFIGVAAVYAYFYLAALVAVVSTWAALAGLFFGGKALAVWIGDGGVKRLRHRLRVRATTSWYGLGLRRQRVAERLFARANKSPEDEHKTRSKVANLARRTT